MSRNFLTILQSYLNMGIQITILIQNGGSKWGRRDESEGETEKGRKKALHSHSGNERKLRYSGDSSMHSIVAFMQGISTIGAAVTRSYNG